ncbi:MAG: hypothetical protein JSR41_10220 [Proteobacteria bacterium]|nr:hypothetical protein [Pseudomonadota bacterium]
MNDGLRWLRIALPLLLLDVVLALGSPGPEPWPHPTARVSLELCAGAALLAASVGWRAAAARWVARVLAGVFAVLVVVRLVDVTALGLFGRPLNLYWDGRHIGSVLAMSELPRWQLVAGGLLVLLALAGVAVGVALCWRALGRGLAWRPGRLAVLVLCGLLVGVRAIDGAAGLDTWRAFSEPVAPVVLRQARLLVAQSQADRSTSRLAPSPAFGTNVDGLQGADVLVLFSESYGVCTFDDPVQSQALDGPRAALAAAIAASGRQVVSARVRSPTFGGGSWLAHAALLTGIDTRDPLDHDLLLSTQRPTLARHFGAHGYRTVHWAPGLQRPWPEGRFYGFERYVDAPTMGYTGLPFGAWRIPDQAAMALLHAQELSAPPGTRAPRFIVFPTVNSHAPFHPLPPFVADWARLTGPQAYTPQQQAQALAQTVSWRDPVPAYVASIALTWQWLGDYLREQAPRGLVLVLLGDHQPWARVSGNGAPWDVPVHIVASDPALLRRFTDAGFTPGLTPPAATLSGMEALTPLLSRGFARP